MDFLWWSHLVYILGFWSEGSLRLKDCWDLCIVYSHEISLRWWSGVLWSDIMVLSGN